MALGLVVGLPSSSRGQAVETANPHPLEAGDAIRLTFSREADMSGEYIVDETGRAALPFIGPVVVTQAPPAQVKRQLEDLYAEQLRNQVIQIVFLRRVRVLGAVNKPGLYHLDPTMTLVDAIALAGGPTAEGEMDDVTILRDGQEMHPAVDDTEIDLVQSGDHIVVGQRSWFSRNTIWVVGTTVGIVGLVFRILDDRR